jgi:hypothetical protein
LAFITGAEAFCTGALPSIRMPMASPAASAAAAMRIAPILFMFYAPVVRLSWLALAEPSVNACGVSTDYSLGRFLSTAITSSVVMTSPNC